MLTSLLVVVAATGGSESSDLAESLSAQRGGTIAASVERFETGAREMVTLRPWSVLTSGASVEVHGRDGVRPARLSGLRQWRGEIAGGWVLLTSTERGARGLTLRHGVVRPLEIMGERLREGLRAVGQDIRVPCSGMAAPEAPRESHDRARSAHTACNTLSIAFETDWEFTNDLFAGDADDAAAYVVELAAAVSLIQEAELGLPIEVTYVRTWSDASDPYDPTEPVDDMLDQFRDEWEANEPESDRHVGHLLSGSSAPASTGLAWRGSACSSWGYAYSSDLDGFFVDPPQDHSWSTWDVLIVAHETGHTIGARHTHEMAPPIDGCGSNPQDCTNAWGGTIMSYCHSCAPNWLTNTVLDFHPRVQADIESFLGSINASTCDLTVPPSTDVNGDGAVDAVDLGFVLTQFGVCGGCGCSADVDGSAGVDVSDLLRVLEEWG